MTAVGPASVSPGRRTGGGRLLISIAAAIGVITAGIAGVKAAGGTSAPAAGTTATIPSTTSTTAAPAAASDVAGSLPAFHEELDRLEAPRPDGPPALLVASSPRQDPPRPVTLTLFEWDRTTYRVADSVELDCGFVEQLVVDEDQAMFLGCTGGASAHWAWAVLPDRLKIRVLPDIQAPWGLTRLETIPRQGQPDDLRLYGKRCDPSCADAKIDVSTLVWDATFRWWNITDCTPDGGVTRRYDPPMNASVAGVTSDGCPSSASPADQVSVADLPGE